MLLAVSALGAEQRRWSADSHATQGVGR